MNQTTKHDVTIRNEWDGWRVYRDGRLAGFLTKYDNGQWSVREYLPDAEFDMTAPLRSKHIKWQPTFQQAKLAAHVVFASFALCLTLSTPTAAHEGGRYDYPIIGTPAYDASCTITQDWEDGSAYAYCAEDGATYFHDPDGQPVPGIPDNPVIAPGWHVVN